MYPSNHIKKGLVLLLLLLLTASASIYTFAESSNSKIDMKVEAGFAGMARMNSKVPFKISLYNKGAAFEGEVQIAITLQGYNASQAYAMACSLPKGARKELVMDIPIRTAKKNVEVRLVRGDKLIKEVEFKFTKMLPPDTPVIGIISEDIGLAAQFSGIKIPRTYKAGLNYMSGIPSSEQTEENVENYQAAQAVELDETSIPDDLEGFSHFDAIIVSNYDTRLLNKLQYEALSKWIEGGGIFLTTTGPNSRKTYDGLDESLRSFGIEKESHQISSAVLQQVSGINPPAGNVSIVKINSTKGLMLYSGGGYSLAAALPKGEGTQAVVAFDPGLEPLAEWKDIKTFWQTLINNIYNTTKGGRFNGTAEVYQNPDLNFNYLVSNVPESRTPPFIMLIFLIGAYILLVGPGVYIFLKWKDKRDWSWLVIPAFALLFMGIIYVGGYKTRYNTAVMNTFSLVRLDFENSRAHTTSYMGIFNNHKGRMKVDYNSGLNLDLSPGSDMGSYMTSYVRPGININAANSMANVASKFTYGNRPQWEFNGTMLWEPRLMYLKNSNKMEGNIIQNINIEEGRIKAAIKNTTGMSFKEAFFVIGNTFIYAGNIGRGEEKIIDVKLNGQSVSRGLTNYLYDRYGRPYQGGKTSNLPKDWRERNRKRNIIEYVLSNINSPYDTNIKLYAFNYEDFKYDIGVNDKKPVVYNTNLVYTQMGLMPKKGERVNIPSGIFRPVLVQKDNAYYDDQVNGTVRVQADSDVNFRLKMPENIKAARLKIKWYTALPTYIKYLQEEKGEPKPVITKNKYTYFIYNVEKGIWEKTGEEKEIKEGLASYVDSTGQVELKAQAVVNKKTPSEELLGVPDIEISGVVE